MSSGLIAILSVVFAAVLVIGTGAVAISIEYLKMQRIHREYRSRNRRNSRPVV
jgi:hypothetical protein